MRRESRPWRRWCWATLMAAALMMGCSEDQGADSIDTQQMDAGDASSSSGSDDASSSDADAAMDAADDAASMSNLPTCDTDGASDALFVQGDYFVALSIQPLGGLLVQFRVNVIASADRILAFEVWARSPDLSWESEAPIARACAIDVVDDAFSVEFGEVMLPGQATTVGVPATIESLVFNGERLDSQSFCGTAEGGVPLLGFELGGSPFRGVPFGEQTSPPAFSCGEVMAITYDPIEVCPALVEGPNTITSAGLERTFVLNAPADPAGGEPLPVVFLYHGLGGSAGNVLGYSNFDALVEAEGLILITPDSARDENGEAIFPVAWNSLALQFDDDNRDLVLFDDLLTCVSEQYTVDPDRVYATGMSAGGIWTTFLGLHRADALAAVAPMSGGYLQAWPDAVDAATPWLVTWGGEADLAVDLDFNDAALSLIADLTANGNALVMCDHGGGHTWPSAMTAAVWAFLSSYTLGQNDDPFADALPPELPAYCSKLQP